LKGKSAGIYLTIVKSNEIEEFGATFPERKDELYRLKPLLLVDKLNVVWLEVVAHKPRNITASEKKRDLLCKCLRLLTTITLKISLVCSSI
jgi:hypothetical protein